MHGWMCEVRGGTGKPHDTKALNRGLHPGYMSLFRKRSLKCVLCFNVGMSVEMLGKHFWKKWSDHVLWEVMWLTNFHLLNYLVCSVYLIVDSSSCIILSRSLCFSRLRVPCECMKVPSGSITWSKILSWKVSLLLVLQDGVSVVLM